MVQILLRSGALFATPFSAHPCRVLAHSVRIFCAFYAFSELSAKCSGCTGLLTEPLGLAWLSTEMLHLLCILRAFTCIYEPECRMRIATRDAHRTPERCTGLYCMCHRGMGTNAHKMRLECVRMSWNTKCKNAGRMHMRH